jgi:hypothetical protein
MIQPSYNWRPRPGVRPPPPDERAVQRRILIAALSSARQNVVRCAARFEMWGDRLDVSVTVNRNNVASVFVPRVGSRGFRRCVYNELEATLAIRGARDQPAIPMTVPFTFVVNDDVIGRDDRDGGFAQPPPR